MVIKNYYTLDAYYNRLCIVMHGMNGLKKGNKKGFMTSNS